MNTVPKFCMEKRSEGPSVEKKAKKEDGVPHMFIKEDESQPCGILTSLKGPKKEKSCLSVRFDVHESA